MRFIRLAAIAATWLVQPLSGPAFAQAPAAAPVPAQGLGGPVIAGVCLLSREAIYANAAVGKAASARLADLSNQAQAEIDVERKPIEADLQVFRAEAAKLSPDQRAQRDQALAARMQPVQLKAQLRAREIEATRMKAMQRIADEAQPVIAQVYTAKKCGLLFDRGSALGGNFANDLTADVVRTLDGKIQTITFERERLPEQPAAPAPAPR